VPNQSTPFYEPWVGSRYRSQPYSQVRLLVVGESSYERGFVSQRDHLRKDTQSIADGNSEVKYSNFWRFIQRSVTGDQNVTPTSQELFWNGVALVNLIQRPMSDKYKRPTDMDFASGAGALAAYIDSLQPQCVIVYSAAAWSPLKKVLRLRTDHDLIVAKSQIQSHQVEPSNECWIADELGPQSPLLLLARHYCARPRTRALVWHTLIGPFIDLVRRGLKSG
jgi:hypothetical protein